MIHSELKRAGVSCKRFKYIARFICHMAQYFPKKIEFTNEMLKYERTVECQYGRSRRGCQAPKKHVFIWRRWTSTAVLLSLDGMVVGTDVKGSMTKALYLEYSGSKNCLS
ncbi:hypothetical protein J132_05106 [Termitomyces sp. J132]|nr:hypothetical protein J132_05106 [Termitomyces sp. J132]